MSAHTPGPDSPMDGSKHASCGHCAHRFGQVWLCPLHTAAPALLEALGRALKAMEAANIAGRSLYGTDVVLMARAAIALAKGETA